MIPIRVIMRGGLGNRMFQYMFASALRDLVSDAVVVNIQMPEFGIEIDDTPMPTNTLSLTFKHHTDILEIAHLLRSGVYEGFEFRAYAQRLQYYPDRDNFMALFPESPLVSIGPDSLVINVRGAEVLGDVHEDYGPVPVDFFSQVADDSGMTPVLVGQLGDDPYSEEIRRRFAGCTIVPSVSPEADFALIRSAHNVVFGVSTFSWLATWLSAHARTIHMPVAGVFDPGRRPDIDLLPVRDERYRFYDLPSEPWVASPSQLHAIVARGRSFPVLERAELSVRRRLAFDGLADVRTQEANSQLVAAVRERDRLSRLFADARAEIRALHAASTEHVDHKPRQGGVT